MKYLANFEEQNNLKRNLIVAGTGAAGLIGLGLGARRLTNRTINNSINDFKFTPKSKSPPQTKTPKQPSLAERRKLNAEKKGVFKRQAEVARMVDEPIQEGLENINGLVQNVQKRKRDLLSKNYVKQLEDGRLEVTNKGKKLLGDVRPEVTEYQKLFDKQKKAREVREILNRTQANAKTIAGRKNALAKSNDYLETPLGKQLTQSGYKKKTFNTGNYIRYRAKQKFGKYNTTNDFNKQLNNLGNF